MSIKIIGGHFRGFPLATPRAITTRPTSVLVKRKLFDWYQNLEGITFIDLCAGSGGMGFEALSRGADKVILNDSQRGAFLTLKDNKAELMRAFKVADEKISLTNLDAKVWAEKELNYQVSDAENTILYIDPPYESHQLYFQILQSLTKLQFQGDIWLESDRLKGPALIDITKAFCSVAKVIEQGDHFVVVGKVL